MGRKKMVKTEERFDIRLRVDSELHVQIQAAADRDHTSVAGWIRAAVVRELRRQEREKEGAR